MPRVRSLLPLPKEIASDTRLRTEAISFVIDLLLYKGGNSEYFAKLASHFINGTSVVKHRALKDCFVFAF